MTHATLRIAATTLLLIIGNSTMAKSALVYIATQNPEKMGITIAELNTDTGRLTAPRMVVETRDPAHFTLNQAGTHLYMCNTGTPGGVSAFSVDRRSGWLTLLNYKESKGRGPSYVSLDGSGKYVLDANYGGGYVEVLSLAKDGSLAEQTSFIQHAGSSVHARQDKPYAHWFRTDPGNDFGLVADLGTDQIVVYRFDDKTGALTPNDPPSVKTPPGSGPRHLVFHPNEKWVYATAELSNEVLAFNWDDDAGTLEQFQAVKTLPADSVTPNTTAEIGIHANGKFLYASNRGEDTIVVFAIDRKSGELSFVQRVPSRGKVPRYFAFDASGEWLLVANQEGGNVAVFKVDGKTGELAPVGDPVPLAKPMGVVFAR
jgi:6-phosphogluconolactonase